MDRHGCGMTREGIVVVGAGLIDVRATTGARWVPGRSLPGTARLLAGGAARNVAVDLAWLGHRVTLLTAVGQDPLGGWLLEVTAAAGVDVTHVTRTGAWTGLYVTVGPDGEDAWCIADAGPAEALAPADLEVWQDVVASAAIVASDANLSEGTHRALAGMVRNTPRALLATSPEKAVRLRAVLEGAAVVVCNRAEARAITGLPDTLSWQALGMALLTEGVERVVVTQGNGGVGIVTGEEVVGVPALNVPVVDATGAGDAVAAVAIHAYLAGLSPARTAELAASAAAVVVQSEENTPHALAAVLSQ